MIRTRRNIDLFRDMERENMNENEKLMRALLDVKKVLKNDFGVESIKSTVSLEDGSKEVYNSLEILEEHIVKYIDSNFQILKNDTFETVNCPHCDRVLQWKEIVEIIKEKNEIKIDELMDFSATLINDFTCPHCHNKFDLSLAITLHSEIDF